MRFKEDHAEYYKLGTEAGGLFKKKNPKSLQQKQTKQWVGAQIHQQPLLGAMSLHPVDIHPPELGEQGGRRGMGQVTATAADTVKT